MRVVSVIPRSRPIHMTTAEPSHAVAYVHVWSRTEITWTIVMAANTRHGWRRIHHSKRQRSIGSPTISAGVEITLHTVNIHRHTSMYSLTFCIHVMSPECHHWKPAVQAASVMLRMPPVDGQSPASSARRSRRAFALCRHIAGWTQACN